MAALRRHVFVGKVLKKLYPEVPRGQEKRAPVSPACRNPPEKVAPERVKGGGIPPMTGGDTQVQPARRLYTVGLPPEGWVPPPPEAPSCSSPESSSSGEDIGDQDLQAQPKRRRIRKHNSKKKFKNPSNIPLEQAELEKQQSILQEKLQPHSHSHTDGPTISKNKKRKLKKKQQIKRKKAAGLLTGVSGVNFMYQPEETSSEQGDMRVSDGEDGADGEGGGPDAEEEGATDAGKEEVKSTNEKADDILNFLKSTQEIYFYDGVSKDSDSAVFMETSGELFKYLETHSMPSSDVFILDHMKTLLLLQDTERLKSALEVFPEHCRMPPDYARVISAFFNYWITHILPEKNNE
ncbi:glutamate-rich protein 1 isoform X1 [Pseudorca crassidens]|uniref:glutamate-rich protein 1 isoform X1 n=1 Tax=Pseudorca crassidens TaxID=82174 RepID=UPI00352FC564